MSSKFHLRLSESLFDFIDTKTNEHCLVTKQYRFMDSVIIPQKSQPDRDFILMSQAYTERTYGYYPTKKQIEETGRAGRLVLKEGGNPDFVARYACSLMSSLANLDDVSVQFLLPDLLPYMDAALSLMSGGSLRELLDHRNTALTGLALDIVQNPSLAPVAITNDDDLVRICFPKCRAFIKSNEWLSDDPRVRAFLPKDDYEDYSLKVKDRLLQEMDGIGLPYEYVVESYIKRDDPDRLMRYLLTTEIGLASMEDSDSFPMQTLFAFLSDRKNDTEMNAFASELICRVGDAGVYLALANYLGQKTVEKLAKEKKFREWPMSLQERKYQWTMYELADPKMKWPKGGYTTLSILHCYPYRRHFYAFPHLVEPLTGNDEKYVKKYVREKLLDIFRTLYHTARGDIAYGMTECVRLLTILSTWKDPNALRYLAANDLGDPADEPLLFAERIRITYAQGKRIAFAEVYESEGV